MDVMLQFRKPSLKGPVLAERIGGKWMQLPQMDQLLSNPVSSKGIEKHISAVGSILALSPANGVFRTAKDVVDPRTGWGIGESAVEQLHETEIAAKRRGIFGVENIGIGVSPENVRREDGKATIEKPETIFAIYNLDRAAKGAIVKEFGIPVEVRFPGLPNDVIIAPITFGTDILLGGYQQKVSVASNPSGYYGLPIVVSWDALVAKTGEAVKEFLKDATETASGLVIATREASEKILERWYLEKPKYSGDTSWKN